VLKTLLTCMTATLRRLLGGRVIRMVVGSHLPERDWPTAFYTQMIRFAAVLSP
jgi:hypothetical protein